MRVSAALLARFNEQIGAFSREGAMGSAKNSYRLWHDNMAVNMANVYRHRRGRTQQFALFLAL